LELWNNEVVERFKSHYFQSSNIPSSRYLEPQVEQLVAAQPVQEELAVLLNFPPTEKAKADIIL